MKFGRAQFDPKDRFYLPDDHTDTQRILSQGEKSKLKVFTGLPKWGKADLPGFYPRGTKNPLLYYSNEFNAIEFNAFYYRMFPPEQVQKWYENSAENFTFFPKLTQSITQFRRLKDCDELVDQFLTSVLEFKHKLGTCFFQMHHTFGPKNMPNVVGFVEAWPKDVKLAVELRHEDWYADPIVREELFDLLSANNVSHILTDTIGRRDMLHMRLTSRNAFVRFTAANNDAVDCPRVDDWINRIKTWEEQGLEEIAFFGHIQAEKEDPNLLRYFGERMGLNNG